MIQAVGWRAKGIGLTGEAEVKKTLPGGEMLERHGAGLMRGGRA